MAVDISGGMLFKISENGGRELIATLQDVEQAMKAATTAGEQHGQQSNKLTEIYRAGRADRREMSFFFREGKDLMMLSTMATMALGNADAHASAERKNLTTALMSGVMTLQTSAFLMSTLKIATGEVGMAIGALLGVGAGLFSFFTGVNEEAKKAAEEGLKQFGEAFSGQSKFGQAGTVSAIDTKIKELKTAIESYGIFDQKIKAALNPKTGQMNVSVVPGLPTRTELQNQLDIYKSLREEAVKTEAIETAKWNVVNAMNNVLRGNYTTVQAINVGLAIAKKELETGVDYQTKQNLTARDYERIQNEIFTLETNKTRIQQGEQPYTEEQVKVIQSTGFELSMMGQHQEQMNDALKKFITLREKAWGHKPLITTSGTPIESIGGKEDTLKLLNDDIKKETNSKTLNELLEKRKKLQEEINNLNKTDEEKLKSGLNELGSTLGSIQNAFNIMGVSADSFLSEFITGLQDALSIVKTIEETIQLIHDIKMAGGILSFLTGLFSLGSIFATAGASTPVVGEVGFLGHTGGIPIAHSGSMLGSNYQGNREAIVKVHAGEEIITPYDPRHRKNGGSATGGSINVNYNVSANDSRSFESMVNTPGHRRALQKAFARAMRSTN